MKKFGFGKKHADGDDPNRSALFGKKGSPAQSDNPYAQPQTANDPYMAPNMTPYQQVRSRVPDRPAGGLPNGPGPQRGYGAPPLSRNDSNHSTATTLPPYSSAPPSVAGGYANDRYGASSGYGASKYSNSGGASGARSGGYGGLGRSDSNDTDSNRDALFSGARERYDQQPHNPGGAYGASGASGASGADSKYGGYGQERELTEEEKDELEVDDIKRQIKQEKLATANTAENTARIGQQTVELASQTLARLGGQAERLNYTENLIDRGGFASREAEEQTKKLKSLNRSMFAVHVGNPFTANKRNNEMEQRVLDQNRSEREQRESTRKDGYQGNMRMESAFRQVDASAKNGVWQKQSAAEKSKYSFEDDDEDEETEDRIDDNMNKTAQSVSQLNTLAHLLGNEIDSQNKVIDRIGNKVSSSITALGKVGIVHS